LVRSVHQGDPLSRLFSFGKVEKKRRNNPRRGKGASKSSTYRKKRDIFPAKKKVKERKAWSLRGGETTRVKGKEWGQGNMQFHQWEEASGFRGGDEGPGEEDRCKKEKRKSMKNIFTSEKMILFKCSRKKEEGRGSY